MRIFKRIFIFPILIHKTTTFYGPNPETWSIAIKFNKSKMAGSMKSTSYTVELWIRGRDRMQWSFVWRPDVTRYWWKKGVV
jgi:hypothetical protein